MISFLKCLSEDSRFPLYSSNIFLPWSSPSYDTGPPFSRFFQAKIIENHHLSGFSPYFPSSPSTTTVNSASKIHPEGFPGGTVVKNLPANAGDTGSRPGLGGYHMPQSN